jgi:hypothetical protein
VAGFFPCDHHIEPSPTPTSSVHANPDIVIDAVGSPEGCTEIALACCNAAMSKMPSFALFEDARSILVKRLIPPPRYGFRHGINLEGLSVPRTALYAHVTSAHHFGIITHCLRYELMFCNTDSDELVNLVSDAGGISCLLQDTVHLASTVALPLVQRQMQVSKTASAHPRRKLYCTIFACFSHRRYCSLFSVHQRHCPQPSHPNIQNRIRRRAAALCPFCNTRQFSCHSQRKKMGQRACGCSGTLSRVFWACSLRPLQVLLDPRARPLTIKASRIWCSWNTGTTFLSDALTQDSWWRLIVYFDVAGMAATRGVLFDAFFASQHMITFANVLLV